MGQNTERIYGIESKYRHVAYICTENEVIDVFW